MRLFAAAMFLGAFLLFLVQPMAGKYVLPWFGGGPAVWTTCMLFFQAVLLAGYAYAHVGTSRLRPRAHAAVHAVLLVAAVAAAWVVYARLATGATPDVRGGAGGVAPAGQILLLLAVGVGLPAFVLAATSPLLNAWYARAVGTGDGADKRLYRLYAVSNAGSLLALLAYPFVVEPLLSRRAQAALWSAGLALFGGVCGHCAWRAGRIAAPVEVHDPDAGAGAGAGAARPAGLMRRVLWLALSACASALLLATTNTLTQDVAAVPFLWVLPLAIYLLTFILAFAARGERPYRAGMLGPMLAGAAAGVCWVLLRGEELSIYLRVAALAGALFVCCIACHGEVAALRPAARHLTAFYLTIAAGGASGGLLVAVAAPLVLDRYAELHISLWACCALALGAHWARSRSEPRSALTGWRAGLSGLAAMGSVAGLVVLAALLWAAATQPLPDSVPIERMRDFYGALTVYATKQHDPQLASLTLMHGSIIHGKQFTHPDRRRLATTYFGPASGVGKAFADLASRQPLGRRVGVVGLGAGTLAAYGRPGDEFKFYELSPNVAVVARDRFTFLSDSPAGVEIVLGDARVSLEREAAAGARPNQFDLLVLDAFSSDAIPVHLLTAEAFDLYRRHLAGEAVVAVHISNQHLDLEPVVARQAERLGWAAVVVHNEDDEALGTLPANWVLLSARPERLRGLSPRPALSQPHVPLWTDEYASLLPVMK